MDGRDDMQDGQNTKMLGAFRRQSSITFCLFAVDVDVRGQLEEF